MKIGYHLVGAKTRCIGRNDTCRSVAVRGDYCVPCWEALPKCANCGHHIDAHDEGPCAVNAHDGATGAECECQEFEAEY